ncbi:MAG: hypothetical protein KGV44_04375 [Flavobacteriaceae bacterium]|nr:hypothetical protein [Flavobacteriaceae bacterium]
MKIFMVFGALYFFLILIGLPFVVFFVAKEVLHISALEVFSKYFLYYVMVDLGLRYFMQSLSSQNIKPFLTLNIPKTKIVKYSFLKFCIYYLNIAIFLFLLIFSVLLIIDDFVWWQVLCFSTGIYFVLMCNNFLNMLLNQRDTIFYAIASVFVLFVVLEYFEYIKLSDYSLPIFSAFYTMKGLFIAPIFASIAIAYVAFKNMKSDFYLDKGLEVKKSANAKTENIDFLNRFGMVGTFINNDIRLIKRNKVPRKVFYSGIFFLFYGLIVFLKGYDNDYMKMFVGFLVTGSFMLNFGARVPAWDSSYYPLMMTMNVPYKDYLNAKWYSMFVMTAIMTVLALPYAFISWQYYTIIFVAGIFNLGVNVHLTLLQGSFNKVPVDLNTRVKQMNKGGFSYMALFLGLMKIFFPALLFALIKYFAGFYPAVITIAVLGIIGIFTKEMILNSIVKRYKREKYETLESFKKGI